MIGGSYVIVTNGRGNDTGLVSICPVTMPIQGLSVGGQELWTDDFCFIDCGECGDGILDPGEECDDGPDIIGDNCDTSCQLGDANGDGDVNITDIVLIVSYILQGVSYHHEADANGDGTVDINDIVLIVYWILNSSRVELDKGPIGQVKLIDEQRQVSIQTEGTIAGIQLAIRGDAQVDFKVPDGWLSYQAENTILLFSMDGSKLITNVLFEYTGELVMESCIAVGWSGEETLVTLITSPEGYSLQDAYPNPFNPITSIDYSIPETSHVEIAIYNMLGMKVARLVDEEKLSGTYHVVWNASDQPSGLYFVKMVAGSFSASRKIILMQ